MEGQKNRLLEWVKAHKKELIIGGVSASVLVGIILGIRNNGSIEALRESLNKNIEKVPIKIPEALQAVPDKVIHTKAMVTDIIQPTETLSIRSSNAIQNTFEGSDHIRNLHEGWYASAEKIAIAAEHGYDLKPGQTWVDMYTKRTVAA